MILGCSNTYQQLVTSLKVDEIRWVLSKRGDSKVGTNSPWAINHKRDGKTKAWLAWLLLIGTSLVSNFQSLLHFYMQCQTRCHFQMRGQMQGHFQMQCQNAMSKCNVRRDVKQI